MTFYTGTATTVNELLTTLQQGCTASGWTAAGKLIYKANCVMEVGISGNTLQVIGGTGQNNGSLTGELRLADNRRLAVSIAGIGQNISYPLLYNLHVFDNEVYLFVNYNVDNWSYIAFGQSPVAGISGTGNWYGGVGSGAGSVEPRYADHSSSNGYYFSTLFGGCSAGGTLSNQGQIVNSFFHHGLDGNEWSCAGTDGVGSNKELGWASTASQADATLVAGNLLKLLPNAYNGEAILLPITPCVRHKDNTTNVLVGDLRYARYTRIDNYEPGQLITLGNKQYKIYPWLKKNTTNRDGQSYNNSAANVQHSGTFGVAILYEGD